MHEMNGLEADGPSLDVAMQLELCHMLNSWVELHTPAASRVHATNNCWRIARLPSVHP